MTIAVKAGSSITISNYPGYHNYTLNGVATNLDTFTQYYAADTNVEFVATGSVYLYSIIIKQNQEAPEAATVESITVNSAKHEFTVGDEFVTDGIVVNAIYTDGSLVTLTAEQYVVNSNAVVTTAAGEYDVVVSFGGKEKAYTVSYEEASTETAVIKSTTLDFTTQDGVTAATSISKIVFSASPRYNGGNSQYAGTITFDVKAGTTVTVTPYADAQYASFTLGKKDAADLATQTAIYSFTADVDCTVVYTGLSNNYILSLTISCPVLQNESYTFGSTNTSDTAKYSGIVASAGNVAINGTFSDHADSIQLKQDSSITLTVAAGATVKVTSFGGGYGYLLINGVNNDSAAEYELVTTELTEITIACVNVGTEEAPAYNKSYIKAITITFAE